MLQDKTHPIHAENTDIRSTRNLNSFDFHVIKYTGQLPQIFPLLLAVTNKVAIMTGVDVVVDADQKLLIVLKSTGKLFHKLPCTFQELVYDG